MLQTKGHTRHNKHILLIINININIGSQEISVVCQYQQEPRGYSQALEENGYLFGVNYSYLELFRVI